MTKDDNLSFNGVLEALFSDDPLPIHLLFRLSDLSVEAYDAFCAGWPEVDDERRRIIVRHLADISEENFFVDFGPVFAFCLQDTAALVRVAALDGLWDAEDVRLVTPILRLLASDKDETVRAAAASALAHYIVLVEWEQLPEHVSPPIIEALLAVYDEPDTAVTIKQAALEAVSAAYHPRVPDLIKEAYESDNSGMQVSAVFAMGNSADKRWLPTVLNEMDSPYADMRAEAARAAGSLGSGDAVSHLGNLTADEDLDVQLAAVYALGQIGGEHARDILVDLIEDPDLEALYDAIDEALEEATLFDGDFDLLEWDEDDLQFDD